MLRAVDIPVLVRKPDGSHLEVVHLPGLMIAPSSGPQGLAGRRPHASPARDLIARPGFADRSNWKGG
ncbi:MAG: hypothetical protein M0C28_14225 [Candidatus Moduliflexus flocculans]|nr:hypothetical protein [Candidatus Moduliflexus flocculans]